APSASASWPASPSTPSADLASLPSLYRINQRTEKQPMRTSITLSALALVALAGCNRTPSSDDDFSDLASLDEKSDGFSKKMKIVGSLEYGQSTDVAYHNPPRYAALKFNGSEGDQIAITIDSGDGSSIFWVLDSKFKVLLRSEDQDPG